MQRIGLYAILLFLVGCYDFNYEHPTFQQLKKEQYEVRSFTQVYALWGLVTIDQDRILCSSNQNLVKVEGKMGFFQYIFTSMTGGLITIKTVNNYCQTI